MSSLAHLFKFCWTLCLSLTNSSVEDFSKLSLLDKIHEVVDGVIRIHDDVINSSLWHVQDFVNKIENPI